MAVKQEADLYAPIKAYYESQGYEVKGEVNGCDLVARAADGELLIVEMKKTFTLPLLLQGVERQRINERVMLAVERNRQKRGAHNQRFGDLSELCRRLGLGLMTVTFFKTKRPQLDILCEPNEQPLRRGRPARQARMVREFNERSGDYNVGGTTGRKLVTAYRERALRCAQALRQHGQLPPRRIAELTGCRQAGTMLRANYYGWFERVERGVYGLRQAGLDALAEYAAVVAAMETKPQEHERI
ncbi:hypothetical protein IDH44_11250 [Paenibacillus sp. IB182496]|uniref:Uncharacterized protein n=1 Tax=Paenibacillus sabuli TaxID=2772509 RepID=A0A927BUS7_9BACL|nr:DUF2161 family putative PD-(D/E)XK-type phosphodiesterase [Paenibacillus sabuli]MBD2845768.1 hypothetical protein [Paenibacillus sabuli]